MKKRKIRKKYWQLYLILVPAVVYVLIFSYGPMYGILMAFENFSPKKGYLGSEWVGLKHFIRFFSYPDFWKLLRNTISISLYSLATFPVNIIVALMINEIRNGKFKKTVQMVTYAPHFLSMVVTCSIVILMVGRDGPIGNLYEFFTGENADLLSKASWFGSIYVWSGVWKELGWGTIIYLAALAGVSPDLIESAKMDGANRMQVIWHINIPCILPTIVIMFIMKMGGLLSVGFEKIFLLQNKLNLDTSRVISTYVYEIGIQGGQFSYSTAIGLFNNIVNIILIICANKIARKISGIGLW